jgi:hypothetical protein
MLKVRLNIGGTEVLLGRPPNIFVQQTKLVDESYITTVQAAVSRGRVSRGRV